jgi:hypothetical protein
MGTQNDPSVNSGVRVLRVSLQAGSLCYFAAAPALSRISNSIGRGETRLELSLTRGEAGEAKAGAFAYAGGRGEAKAGAFAYAGGRQERQRLEPSLTRKCIRILWTKAE